MIRLWLLLVVCCTQLHASFVSCHLMGQLGNQLFQIATTLSYAWDHGVTPLFPELYLEEHGISYNKDRIFFRLDASTPPRPFAHVFDPGMPCAVAVIPHLPDLYLFGYYQSWKYFDHHRDELLEVFTPSPTDAQLLQEKYGDLLAHPNTVAVHVRTSLWRKHQEKVHPFVGFDYYKEAFGRFPEEALFVIFSDRIGWCKKHLPGLCKNVVFIEGNDHVLDLYLMSKMKHVIVGTSSFSWWGAYLNENPDKQVIVPDHWMHPNALPCLAYLEDYYLPEWTVIPVVFGEYPEDLMYPEERSLSLDDN